MLFEQWFKLRKINFIGLPIIIENPKGSYREGVDPDGTPWKSYMYHAYGYVHGTTGADDEGIDCYIGPNENCTHIYIVNQQNPQTKEFDEHKVMIGFNSPKHAYKSYIKQYDDPNFYQSMKIISVDKFKQMINNNQLKTKQQNIKKEYVIYCNNKQINEDINIPINMGDTVLTGKFKNKKFIVKSVGKDDLGQPVVKNDKGKEVKLLAVRIEKLMKNSTGVKKEENVLFNKNVMYKYLKSLAVNNKLDISIFKPSQVIAGYKVEKEHDKGNDVDVAKNDLDVLKIVVAHLREKSDYYTRLKKVEESSKMKLKEYIQQEVKNCIKENDTEYQKFFKSALDKFGVKSQDELSDEKKKEFFNYVDRNYKAKNESIKTKSKKMITEQLNFKSDVMYKFAELKSEFYKYETFLEFEVSDPVQQTEEYQQLKSQINNVKKCLVMLNNNLKKTFDVVNTVGQHEQKIKEQEKMQKSR